MDLTGANLIGDSFLAHVLKKPKVEDFLLSGWQLFEQLEHNFAVEWGVEAAFDGRRISCAHGVKALSAVGVVGFECFDHYIR